jgi:hypothetical protein
MGLAPLVLLAPQVVKLSVCLCWEFAQRVVDVAVMQQSLEVADAVQGVFATLHLGQEGFGEDGRG